ncbi:MAG: L,D-transpeptidase [Mesorhizobium sp.]
MQDQILSRRKFIGGAALGMLALSGCASTPAPTPRPIGYRPEPVPEPAFGPYADMYSARFDGEFELPAIPYQRLEQRYLRQIVRDPTGEAPGTVVVDVANHFLYLVRGGGEAIRYGVGLGREGFAWSGRAIIEWKQHWPRWFPPADMIARQPDLEKYKAIQIPGTNNWEGGMAAGINNPLGARALYLYQDGVDTLYRIHGSPEWWTMGKSVSSGCVRMMNQDIVDLYDRVPEKSPVLVTNGIPTV